MEEKRQQAWQEMILRVRHKQSSSDASTFRWDAKKKNHLDLQLCDCHFVDSKEHKGQSYSTRTTDKTNTPADQAERERRDCEGNKTAN